MNDIIAQMEQSDIWILGTPVYWWGPTAQMKTFVDRWYGIKQSIFQGKKMLLIVPMGGGNEHYSRHVVGMFEDICNYLGIEFFD
jgi:multimeric flavodoxin WrbA